MNLGHGERIGVGLLAAILVLCNKVSSQGASGLVEALKHLTVGGDRVFQMVGFGVSALVIALMCMGVAWLVTESDRMMRPVTWTTSQRNIALFAKMGLKPC